MDAKQLMQYFGAAGIRRGATGSSPTAPPGADYADTDPPEVVGTELTSREQLRKYNAKEKGIRRQRIWVLALRRPQRYL